MNITKNINKHIFRGYDIRGINDIDLNEDVAYTIGATYACILKDNIKADTVVVGMDNRVSSKMLKNALIQGIIACGVNVIDIGLVTSPMLYYANEIHNIHAGIMVTASHNPSEYNGFKIAFDKKGEICGDEIIDFMNEVLNFNQKKLDNVIPGSVKLQDISKDYANMLISKFNFKNRLKIVVDCGNGTASIIVKDVFSKFNLDVDYIFCDSDPTFPNHHPDPADAKNLVKLCEKVVNSKANLGIAFDGDCDRVGIVDDKGRTFSSDYYMSIISKNIMANLPVKKVIFDVSCSKTLCDEIRKVGGEPVIYKTGNSYIKREMLDKNMLFGGEISGHTFFKDKFYGFDDGIYAGLRMLEIVDENKLKLSDMIDELVHYYSTPIIKIGVADDKKASVVEKVKDYCAYKGYNTNTIDGARVEFIDGFAIVRMSNTTPNLTLRFEAQTEYRLEEIKKEFVELVENIVKDI